MTPVLVLVQDPVPFRYNILLMMPFLIAAILHGLRRKQFEATRLPKSKNAGGDDTQASVTFSSTKYRTFILNTWNIGVLLVVHYLSEPSSAERIWQLVNEGPPLSFTTARM